MIYIYILFFLQCNTRPSEGKKNSKQHKCENYFEAVNLKDSVLEYKSEVMDIPFSYGTPYEGKHKVCCL